MFHPIEMEACLLYDAVKVPENSLESIQVLLRENYADKLTLLEYSDEAQRTVLHETARIGRDDILRYLIDEGANISSRDGGGFTALEYAAKENHYECLRMLVEEGGDVNTVDCFEEWTPLIWAARNKNVEAMILLLQNGADMNTLDTFGVPILSQVCLLGADECVRFLIENGVDINTRCEEDVTPIMYCSKVGSLECLRLLLEARGGVSDNLDAVDMEGHSALSYAKHYHNEDCAALLISYGASEDYHVIRDGGIHPPMQHGNQNNNNNNNNIERGTLQRGD